MTFHHVPVLLDEVLEILSPGVGERYLDVTLGGAGHASAVASRIGADGLLVGFDRDPDAQAAARERLKDFPVKQCFIESSFIEMDGALRARGFLDRAQGGGFDMALADFGLSSHQIDEVSRGFSFQACAPLDMRMSRSGESAREFLKRVSEDSLADILYEYGDIRQSRRLARLLSARAHAGALETTASLAQACCEALGYPRPGQPHPATRVFQAIRIAVNDEFGAIDSFLSHIARWMAPGGRLAVISFHSGEDRRVKEAFRAFEHPCTCPPKLPVCVCHKKPLGRSLTKKPLEATPEELQANSRARSAKLRGFLFD